jgi:hypothetical protein
MESFVLVCISRLTSSSRPRKAASVSAAYGTKRAWVALESAFDSSTSDAAARSSPAKTSAPARVLSASGSMASAPTLRATSIWRAVSASQPSWSQIKPATGPASHHQRMSSSVAVPSRNARSARFNTGVPTDGPSVMSRASPRRSRSPGSGGCGDGGAPRAASATSRTPAPRARRPANSAAAKASR